MCSTESHSSWAQLTTLWSTTIQQGVPFPVFLSSWLLAAWLRDIKRTTTYCPQILGEGFFIIQTKQSRGLFQMISVGPARERAKNESSLVYQRVHVYLNPPRVWNLKLSPLTTKNRPFVAEIWHPNGGSRYSYYSWTFVGLLHTHEFSFQPPGLPAAQIMILVQKMYTSPMKTTVNMRCSCIITQEKHTHILPKKHIIRISCWTIHPRKTNSNCLFEAHLEICCACGISMHFMFTATHP